MLDACCERWPTASVALRRGRWSRACAGNQRPRRYKRATRLSRPASHSHRGSFPPDTHDRGKPAAARPARGRCRLCAGRTFGEERTLRTRVRTLVLFDPDRCPGIPPDDSHPERIVVRVARDDPGVAASRADAPAGCVSSPHLQFTRPLRGCSTRLQGMPVEYPWIHESLFAPAPPMKGLRCDRQDRTAGPATIIRTIPRSIGA